MPRQSRTKAKLPRRGRRIRPATRLPWDRECAVADLLADALRERMGGDLAVVAARQALPVRSLAVRCAGARSRMCALRPPTRPRPPDRGPAPDTYRRRAGSRLCRGPSTDATREERGLFHLSGAVVGGTLLVQGKPVDPQRVYRVARTIRSSSRTADTRRRNGVYSRSTTYLHHARGSRGVLRRTRTGTVTMGRLKCRDETEATKLNRNAHRN